MLTDANKLLQPNQIWSSLAYLSLHTGLILSASFSKSTNGNQADPETSSVSSVLLDKTHRLATKFNLKMKEVISDRGWLCDRASKEGRIGVCVCVSEGDAQSQRSDAGMPHLLDNPICSVINRTHYWRRDGSALIKASSFLLRAFIRTHTQHIGRPIFISSISHLKTPQEVRGV